ncbi:Ig-like domain-containing protein, partial [Hafnia alvei]
QTTVTLTSTTTAVANITVSAQVGTTASKNADKTVSFIADAATAQVSTVTLVDSDVSKVADGKNAFTYTVTVKDSNGNPISGATVTPKADKSGVTAEVAGPTDAKGQTTVTLTSSTLSVAGITVSAQVGNSASKNADKTVSFIADVTTASVKLVSVPQLGTFFVGSKQYEITATLVDNNNNPITQTGVEVEWKVSSPEVILSGDTSSTSSGGSASIKVNSYTPVSGVEISAKTKVSGQNWVNGNYTLSFTPEYQAIGPDRDDISADQLANAFAKNDSVLVHNENSKWFGRIHLPDAESFPGKTLVVIQESSWASNLFFDGKTKMMCRTNKYTLVSNGTNWIFSESGNRPSSQCTLAPGGQNPID